MTGPDGPDPSPLDWPDLPPGWQTDLAVLRHTGSTVQRHADHLVVRTPANPGFHWGNFVLVTDLHRVDEAETWVGVFRACFPAADWTAVGLAAAPTDPTLWTAAGLQIELEDVLVTLALPRLTPEPSGYLVRPLAHDDWEQVVARAVAENEQTGDHEAAGYERFVRARAEARRDLCERGAATFVGAFVGDRLAASLGVVRCGRTARYQDVATAPEHQRRGLAGHLIGHAGRWAAEQGCRRWVILSEPGSDAGRLYRSLGFQPDTPNVQAYRPGPA